MKKILYLLLLIGFGASAQNDTAKYFLSKDYGWTYQRIKGAKVIVLPTDTVNNKLGIAAKGSILYVGNGSYWAAVVGASPAVDSIHVSGNTICWTVSGVTQCATVSGATYRVGENFDTTKLILYENGTAIDSAAYQVIPVTSHYPVTIDDSAGVKIWGIDPGYIPAGTITNGIYSGGNVSYSGSGYTYDVTSAIYFINSQQYTSASGSVTLATSDPTFDRIDVIALNTSGTIVTITGTPASNPQVPQIDPATQLQLTSIIVKAASTTPGITTQIIYDENTEWTVSADVGIITNANNTVNPLHLTKSVDVSMWATVTAFSFTAPSPVNVSDFALLKMFINLKSGLPPGAALYARFFNGNTAVSAHINLSSFGFSITGAGYQNVTIPLSSVSFTGDQYTKLQIVVQGSGSGFYMDYVQLQGGIVNGSSPYVTDVIKSNDTLYKVKNGIKYFIGRDSVGSGGAATDTTSLSNRINGKVDKSTTITINGLPFDLSTNRTWTIPIAAYVVSFGKNITSDSLVLLLSDGTRYAAKDSTGGGSATVKQVHTTGSTVTVNNTTTWLVVNPASALPALTATTPATPLDGQILDISFGGTISASGSTVVTNFTITPNTGQGIVGTGIYGTVEADDHIAYRYNSTNSKWYRN